MDTIVYLIVISVLLFISGGLVRVYFHNKREIEDTEGLYNKIRLFFNDYTLYYRSIAIFFVTFLLLYRINFINKFGNFEEILIAILTLILVYATLSLLSFTYSLVIKNDRNKEIIEHELKGDKNLNSIITKSIKQNSEKIRKTLEKEDKTLERINEIIIEQENSLQKKLYESFIIQRNKEKINNEINIKRIGEAFFMATILSSLGFFIIFLSIIFSKIPLDSTTVISSFVKNISSNQFVILFYFNFAFIFIVYGILNFLKGLFKILSILMEKNDDEFI